MLFRSNDTATTEIYTRPYSFPTRRSSDLRVDALVDRTAAVARGARDQTSEAQLRGLVGDLDQTMAFFRLEPRRTIREDGD